MSMITLQIDCIRFELSEKMVDFTMFRLIKHQKVRKQDTF